MQMKKEKERKKEEEKEEEVFRLPCLDKEEQRKKKEDRRRKSRKCRSMTHVDASVIAVPQIKDWSDYQGLLSYSQRCHMAEVPWAVIDCFDAHILARDSMFCHKIVQICIHYMRILCRCEHINLPKCKERPATINCSPERYILLRKIRIRKKESFAQELCKFVG